MKKIIISTVILLLFAANPVKKAYSLPNIYVDITSAYIMADDAFNHYAPGWALGVYIHRNLNVFYKGSITLDQMFIKNEDAWNREEDDFMTHLWGAEYCYHFNQIGIKSSLAAGFTDLKALVNWRHDESGSYQYFEDEFQSTGFTLVASIGVIYDLKQFVSLFIDAGYQYAVFKKDFYHYEDTVWGYDESDDISFMGLQVTAGVRLTIGANQRAGSDY